MARDLLLDRDMGRESNMADALERTVEAGQSLFALRLELIVAEAKALVREGGAILVVTAVAVAGWAYLMRGVTDGLSEIFPRFAVELGVGLVHLTAAWVVLLRKRAR